MAPRIDKGWFKRQAAKEGEIEISAGLRPCYCIGPQPGEELCPCMLNAQREEEFKRYDDQSHS
jgi:hypothetical protein